MTGIEKLGVHIPKYRLARTEIAALWGGRAKAGERSVASYDEDAVTMAVEAAEQCLDGVDRGTIDLVVLSSTTLPYAEKQAAAMVAEALDLRTGIDTLDIASSLRGGTQALRVGLNALANGARRVLVAVADLRKTEAGGRMEPDMGDGAAAFLLGPDAAVAVRPLRTEYSTTMDRWRLAGEETVRTGDDRFTSKIVFQDSLAAAIRQAMADSNLTPALIRKIAIPGADHRAALSAAAAAGFKADAVAGEEVYAKAGHCGAAMGPIMLASALEQAKAGDAVLLANYGDGADVLLATANGAQPVGAPVQRALAGARALKYGQFLRIKGLVETETITPYTSEISIWRDAAHLQRLRAPKCAHCGAIQYPPRRICYKCRTKDQFVEVPLAKHGTLFTFTVEHLYPVPDNRLITGVVDLADGARIFTQITDCVPDDVKVGMNMRLAFRALHRGGGFYHYFWKAAPEPV